MSEQLALIRDGHWRRVDRCDARARALADRHYSRQTPGALNFMANGRTLVLLTDDARAVWGCIEMLGFDGARMWRCSIFRNEGPVLSSGETGTGKVILEAPAEALERQTPASSGS